MLHKTGQAKTGRATAVLCKTGRAKARLSTAWPTYYHLDDYCYDPPRRLKAHGRGSFW